MKFYNHLCRWNTEEGRIMKKGYSLPLIILFVFVGVIALPSLLKKDENKNSMSIEDFKFSFNKGAVSYNMNFLCNQGVVTVDTEDRLEFTSFRERTSIILCNMVDCEHNSADCPAWFKEENVYAVYYYNDKQYIISDSRINIRDKIALYEANADGTNRQTIEKFNYYNLGSYYCIDGIMYMFVGDYDEKSLFSTDENGNMIELPQTVRFISYNLENGEIKEHAVFKSGYQQNYYFLGEYKGKIYYKYQRSEKPRQEIRDENGLKMEEIYEKSFKMGIGCIDVKGNEPEEAIIEKLSVSTIGLYDGKLYWYIYEDMTESSPNEIYVYDIDSKLTEIIHVDIDAPESDVRIVDNKLFYNYWEEEGFTVYDLESGKITDYDENYYVVGEYEDYYLISTFAWIDVFSHVIEKNALADEKAIISICN